MQEKSNLEQQKKDLQMTLSKLTHEIRNPIALIQSELQMIASAHPEITDFDGWYHVMENLEYIRNLLNELSQYNNAEHLTLIQTDMSAFLNSVTRSFQACSGLSGNFPDHRHSGKSSSSFSGSGQNASGIPQSAKKRAGIHSALTWNHYGLCGFF